MSKEQSIKVVCLENTHATLAVKQQTITAEFRLGSDAVVDFSGLFSQTVKVPGCGFDRYRIKDDAKSVVTYPIDGDKECLNSISSCTRLRVKTDTPGVFTFNLVGGIRSIASGSASNELAQK